MFTQFLADQNSSKMTGHKSKQGMFYNSSRRSVNKPKNNATSPATNGSVIPEFSALAAGRSTSSHDATVTGYPFMDMSIYEDYLHPIYKDGDVVLEVECGDNQGLLYLSRLCQGSKGPCIQFNGLWLTPNEFQYVSGRETAKDWKRSIRHHGKSMKLLLSKGILAVHPPICDCDGCQISSPVSRNGKLLDPSKQTVLQMPALSNSKPGQNKKRKLHLPASHFSDHMDLPLLIAQTQKQAKQLEMCLEKGSNSEAVFVNRSPDLVKKKRETLNGIINQILSIKAKRFKETDAKIESNTITFNTNFTIADSSHATNATSVSPIDQYNSDNCKSIAAVTNEAKSIKSANGFKKFARSEKDKFLKTNSRDSASPVTAQIKSPTQNSRNAGLDSILEAQKSNCSPWLNNNAKVNNLNEDEFVSDSKPANSRCQNHLRTEKECLTPNLLDSPSPHLASPLSSPDSISSRILFPHQNLLLGLNCVSASTRQADQCRTLPIIKQMEEVINQNYSNIIRNLAARYNNTNMERCNRNGVQTTTLLDNGNQKSLDLKSVYPYGFSKDLTPNQVLRSMAQTASTSTNSNSSQLDVYNWDSIKRPLEEDEKENCTVPLDLSINNKQRPQLGTPAEQEDKEQSSRKESIDSEENNSIHDGTPEITAEMKQNSVQNEEKSNVTTDEFCNSTN